MNSHPTVRRLALLAALATALLSLDRPADLAARINPTFTPVELVRQCEAVLIGRLAGASTTAPAADATRWRFQPVEQLKGKPALPAGPAVAIDLAGCNRDHVVHIRALLTEQGSQSAILFLGRDRGFLHVGGQWVDLARASDDGAAWRVKGFALEMSATVACGTDSLVRMTRYIVADPSATVPVTAGIEWMAARPLLAKLDGTVAGMEAVRLGPRRDLYLFVACDTGDRVFRPRPNAEAFDDVTARFKLDTRSRRFAWLDSNGDGQIELLSWDGQRIVARTLAADGTFQPMPGEYKTDRAVFALDACHRQTDGAPAVLLSSADLPTLLTRDRQGAWRAEALPFDGSLVPAGRDKAVMPCIVADLDNDGYWDVLQPRTKVGLLWRGGARGFAAPTTCPVAVPDDPGAGPRGPGAQQPCFALGDFNHDGLLDIFISGPASNELWQNECVAGATPRFVPVSAGGGSLSYKSAGGASECRATDLNHDGRTDLCVLYATGELAYHFNRGFGCFGEEGEVRLAALPDVGSSGAAGAAGGSGGPGPAKPGASAVADFNGDGSLDLAVAFTDGGGQRGSEVRCFYNEAYSRPMVHLRLGAKAGVGPVTARVWAALAVPPSAGPFRRCLGAVRLTRPLGEAVVPIGDTAVDIEWRCPGKPDRVRKLARPATMPDEGIEVVLDP